MLGAYFGRGRRQHVLGSFLLGAWDANNNVFQPVCKVGTGFTDTDLAEISQRFSRAASGTDPSAMESTLSTHGDTMKSINIDIPNEYDIPRTLVSKSTAPDVWFDSSITEVCYIFPAHFCIPNCVDNESSLKQQYVEVV